MKPAVIAQRAHAITQLRWQIISLGRTKIWHPCTTLCMETLISILFPLVWVCTCLVAAIGVRLRQPSWPQAMVIASMMAATLGLCGGSHNAQIGVAFGSGLFAFIALDLRSIMAASTARKPSGQTASGRDDAAHPARTADAAVPSAAYSQPAPMPRPKATTKTAPVPTPKPNPEPACAAPRGTVRSDVAPSHTHPTMSRYERERLGRRAEEALKTAMPARKQGPTSSLADNPVEVILPAERAVLRRQSSTRGYWIAKTANGEVEVYLPPGAEAYPGRPVSLVTKSNGTLMGVPVVNR